MSCSFVRTPCAVAAAQSLLAGLLLVASSAASAQQAGARAAEGASALPALGEVVVTATTTEREIGDAPASISVIDGESLRNRPVYDLADAVRGSAGLGIQDMGLGGQGISLRGMDAEHTLILIDGQRINASAGAIAHSDFETGWVPAQAIERVEVVRGPMSSLYGSEALGGVVNVVTRVATDVWQGSVTTYALANDHSLGGDQRSASFYAGGPLLPGKLGLNVWGEAKRRDALHDAANRDLVVRDDNRARLGHVGLNWMPAQGQRVDVSFDAGREDREALRGTANPYQTDSETERRRYAIGHRGEWAWGESQVRLYRSTLKRSASRSDGGELNSPNHFTDTVLDGRATLKLAEAHRLTLGGETRREALADPSVNRAGRMAQTHYALFAQDEWQIAPQWELVLGGRVDRHEEFGWEASPRAYLLFTPAEGVRIKAGAGRGFKAPTLKQLSPEYESRAAMGGRGIIRGNPALEPETNQAFELGVELERGRWQAGAMLFHNDVRNLIQTVRQPTCDVPGRVCLAYENRARARLQGLELTGGVVLPGSLRLDANYTWLDAQDRSAGTRLAERSRHRANATVQWAPLDALSTRLRAEYVGAQYRSATQSDRPGYTLLHWYVDYELGHGISLNGGVENLTDKRLSNDDASVYSQADDGRRYFIGLTARF